MITLPCRNLASSFVAFALAGGVASFAASGATAEELATRPLKPAAYHVKLSDLPQPNEKESVNRQPKKLPVPDAPVLYAPAGFKVTVFAEDVKGARWLALTPSGDVLVTQTKGDDIVLLRDTDGDGVADVQKPFGGKSQGLHLPFGLAFAEGALFVGNTDGVMKFPYSKNQDTLEANGTRIYELPGEGYNQHWTRNVILTPDRQHLYVTVGSASNVDIEPSPRSTVLTMNLNGADARVVASGLRNPVGLAVHPATGELYASVNERDKLGDGLVPDYYITRVKDGAFYGFPYAYLDAKNLDPRRMNNEGGSVNPEMAAKTVTPDVLIEAHSAALGLTFYTGKVFPERYRKGAFAALRGSWNRHSGTGYKIIFVPFNAENRPVGGYEDFVTGFLTEPKTPATWGRPVGIMEMPDGSLLFTDDTNDRVYRISYDGARPEKGVVKE